MELHHEVPPFRPVRCLVVYRSRFTRIHRSTIVRIDRIAELEALSNRDCLLRLRDGTPLRASRTYVEQLRAALAAR